MSNLKEKIKAANDEAVRRLTSAKLILEDIVPAKEVIPFLRDNEYSLLHAGPPREWSTMCEAMKGSIIGMVLLEGWAKTVEEAKELLNSGKVVMGSNNEHFSVGPMSGIITPSFPVYVVYNETFGNRSYSRPADLHQQFGNYNKIDAVREWRDLVAPNLRKGLKALEPTDLMPILQTSLEMGDELHNRVNSFTILLVNHLTFGMIKANVPSEELEKTLDFCFKNPNGVRLTLGLAMACGQAILNPMVNIDYCTFISCMCRNGVDWAVRLASIGNDWFKAPSPTCHKYFIFPGYTREDFGNDMGDSVITETAGWGGLIMANSMALAYNVGASPEEAFEISKINQSLVYSSNPSFKVPAFAYNASPLGIDVRKVIKNKQTPIINTGIAHREEGHSVVARGLLNPPIECFQQAFDAFCAKYSVTAEELISSLD